MRSHTHPKTDTDHHCLFTHTYTHTHRGMTKRAYNEQSERQMMDG